MSKSKKFYMAGTEGTGQYIVLAATSRGRVGLRVLSGDAAQIDTIDRARVRVDPSQGSRTLKAMSAALPDTEWKQPCSTQHRFSIFIYGDDLVAHLQEALAAIGVGSLITQTNPDLPEWAGAVVGQFTEA